MDLSISINWTSSLPILGLLGGIFHYHSNLIEHYVANSGDPDQTPRSESVLFAYVPQKERKA